MKKCDRVLILLSILTLLAGCANAPSLTSVSETSSASQPLSLNAAEPFTYQDYEAVLKNYVNEQGLVNYRRLQANREPLDRFNAAVGNVSPSIYAAWSEKEKIAFLINAYNAFTLQAIIDQKPLKKSIRDIPGVWQWHKFQIVGQSKTLDNIEHNTLRQDFQEPRIHVALVCAAISCPILRNEPYIAEKLDEQLNEQVSKFINSSQGFRIDRQANKVYLSSIFKWYGDDWKQSYSIANQFAGSEREKAVLNFLSNYLSTSEKTYLKEGGYNISYLNYNWLLNQQ